LHTEVCNAIDTGLLQTKPTLNQGLMSYEVYSETNRSNG